MNAYDGRSFRITRLAYSGGDLSETRDFYQSLSWQVLEERVSGTPERQYVWGLRYIDDLILRDRSNGGVLNERLYALQDANWNMVALCDESGNVQERFNYTAYGVPTALNPDFSAPYSGSDYDWTVLYTGQVLDPESGLYYYRMRYYHPGLGVFVSRDPIEANSNPYAYVGNAPLAQVDPDGLEQCEWCCCVDSLEVKFKNEPISGPFGISEYYPDPKIVPYWGDDKTLGTFVDIKVKGNDTLFAGTKFQVIGKFHYEARDDSFGNYDLLTNCTFRQEIRQTAGKGGTAGPWFDDMLAARNDPGLEAGKTSFGGLTGIGKSPSTGVWAYTDPPKINYSPKTTDYAKQEFRICYYSSECCPTKSQECLYFTQQLEIKGGIPTIQFDPGVVNP